MEAVTKKPTMDGVRKFLGTRRGALTVAGGTALLAAVALLAYLSDYRSSVKSGTTPTSVLIADRLIPKGTSGDVVATDRLFRPTTLAEDEVRDNSLANAAALAPAAKRLFQRTDPLIELSKTALPAATTLLKEARPLVQVLFPVASDLVPTVRYLAGQQDQVLAATSNIPAAVNAVASGQGTDPIHYLRAITYFSNEGFVGYKQRLGSNRRNPYLKDMGLLDVRNGSAIKAYDCDNVNNPDTAPEPSSAPACVQEAPWPKVFGGGMFPRLTREAP